MTNSNPDPQPSRRDQLHQKQQQQAQERKVRNYITFGILGVAVLAIVGVIVAVALNVGSAPKADGGGAATGDNTLVIGKPDAPVTISIYQDYMCPYCGKFERANRDDLEKLVADGKAKVELHLMNFIDRASQGTKYSSRAANAVVEVAKAQPDKVMAFNAALYDNQPEEGSAGLTDAQIADLARKVGVNEQVIGKFAQMANQDFVDRSNTAAAAAGVTSTPTVKINGQNWPADKNDLGKLYEAGQLKAAVEEAAKK